jgi:Ran GTPase-activating protein (RanGAP) involved in mRNA processing and transport
MESVQTIQIDIIKSKEHLNQLLENYDNHEQIINYYCNILHISQNRMDNKLEISNDCIIAPRLNSAANKKYTIAYKIAIKMFPPENKINNLSNLSDLSKTELSSKLNETNETNKTNETNELEDSEDSDNSVELLETMVHSYIKYGKLIATLSLYYRAQEEKRKEDEKYLKNIKKEILKNKDLWNQLKNKPIANEVTNPTPMPVNIAPYEHLEDFFKFIDSNQPVPITHGEFIKFTRGTFFNDGRMDLCKQVVGPSWIGNLMDSLVNNEHIKHFLLGNNIINITGAKCIANFLLNPHKSKIETWYLAGNCIDRDGIDLLCNAFIDSKDNDMISLWLKRNPITSDGALSITKLLKNNQHIKILDLHNTALFNDGLKNLVEGLKENNSLRHVYLSSNGITAYGISYLADYFENRKHKGLTSLWLDMNRLGDDGAILLLKSLQHYPYLKRLCLGSCALSPMVMPFIYECLRDKENLIFLDIGCYKSTGDMGELPNKISDDGVDFLIKLLKCTKIKSLRIDNNEISPQGLEKLVNSLESNEHIIDLVYYQYGTCYHKNLHNKINNIVTRNTLSLKDKIPIRHIRYSKKIDNIDSIYRNK